MDASSIHTWIQVLESGGCVKRSHQFRFIQTKSIQFLIWVLFVFVNLIGKVKGLPFKHQFFDNLSEGSVENLYNLPNGSPKFHDRYKEPDSNRRNLNNHNNYDDVGRKPIFSRLGVMFIEESGLASYSYHDMSTPKPFSIILWVYIYKVDQKGCIFGKIDLNRRRTPLSLGIENNRMKMLVTTYPSSGSSITETEFVSTQPSHFGQGWNLLSYTDNNANFVFKSRRNFSGAVITSVSSRTNYNATTDAILGSYRYDDDLMYYFQGIVHTMWIVGSSVTDSELLTQYSRGGGS